MLKVMSFINMLQHLVTLNQALVTLVLLLNTHLLGLTTAPPLLVPISQILIITEPNQKL